LLLSMPLWGENYRMWQNPFGPSAMFKILNNEEHGIRVLLSNMIRNLALHCVIPVAKYRTLLTGIIVWIHNVILHIDASLPATTMSQKFELIGPVAHEDYAGNPLQLFLLVIALVVIFLGSKKKNFSQLKIYTVCIGLAFALFCFLLKWQPWHSRLHTPLFILAAVPIAMALNQLIKNWKATSVGLFCLGLPWVVFNDTRPLRGGLEGERIHRYFIGRPQIEMPYLELMAHLESLTNKTHCKNIGLKTIDDTWEYPLWMLARERNLDVNFRHIDVPFKETPQAPTADLCAYVAIDQNEQWRPAEDNLKVMKLVWMTKDIQLYTR